MNFNNFLAAKLLYSTKMSFFPPVSYVLDFLGCYKSWSKNIYSKYFFVRRSLGKMQQENPDYVIWLILDRQLIFFVEILHSNVHLRFLIKSIFFCSMSILWTLFSFRIPWIIKINMFAFKFYISLSRNNKLFLFADK